MSPYISKEFHDYLISISLYHIPETGTIYERYEVGRRKLPVLIVRLDLKALLFITRDKRDITIPFSVKKEHQMKFLYLMGAL